MKCAIGGEADIPATQRFFVQGQHAQGDRHLNASRTRFIPEQLFGRFERTTWPVVSADTAARTASQRAKAGYPCPACGGCGDRTYRSLNRRTVVEQALNCLSSHRNNAEPE
jgi:hypothetical protein